MTGPVVSIVIPVRNRPGHLEHLLDDIARLDGAAPGTVETVVVDDASEPPAATRPRPGLDIRLLRLPVRTGANGARRRGLAEARGRYVHFHDSDDRLAHDWLSMIAPAIEAGAEIIVTRRVDEIADGARVVAQWYFERHAGRPDRIRRMLAFRNCLGPLGGVTFARHLLSPVDFPDMPSSQDWALYRRVYEAQPRGAAVAAAGFVYCKTGTDRISASARRKFLGAMRLAREVSRPTFPALHRLYLLHAFRQHASAAGRPSLDAILRRTRLSRWAAHTTATAWMMLALGWR